SISTLIPMQNPLDLFYIHNPDKLFGPIKEEVLITLNNKYVIKNHLCCASKESPLRADDYLTFGINEKSLFIKYLEELVSETLLMKRGDRYYWNSDFFPNEKFGLNDLSNRSYKILLRINSGEEFLTIEDESYVFRDLHEGAVYLYEAETYIVDELDLDEKKVYLKRSNVDFYTQSLKHTDITPLEIISEGKIGRNKNIDAFFGNVKVEHEYYSYKVIDSFTQETRSRHPLENIPIIEFESQALWYLIPFEFQKELELVGYNLGGTIHAIEHAMIAMAPALAQISRWDLGGVSIDFDPVKQQPIIYIYDAYKGGIGISETLYYNLSELIEMTYSLIKSCSCKSSDGCPGCIMSPKCGNNNDPLDKNGALFLLEKIKGKN
ncbi:MAG: Zn-binding domain-containing protein, partial [Promethearchaeota archaeon]